MNKPIDIDYDSITNHNAEGIDFIIDTGPEITLTVPHGLIITHDKEKKVIQVPESFAIRNDLI